MLVVHIGLQTRELILSGAVHHTTILTPEGDVASSTHVKGSWVGLSEDH